jgi:hypothetical protein
MTITCPKPFVDTAHEEFGPEVFLQLDFQTNAKAHRPLDGLAKGRNVDLSGNAGKADGSVQSADMF